MTSTTTSLPEPLRRGDAHPPEHVPAGGSGAGDHERVVATRYLAHTEPTASMRPEEVARTFGPLVQAVIDGDFDSPAG